MQDSCVFANNDITEILFNIYINKSNNMIAQHAAASRRMSFLPFFARIRDFDKLM